MSVHPAPIQVYPGVNQRLLLKMDNPVLMVHLAITVVMVLVLTKLLYFEEQLHNQLHLQTIVQATISQLTH